VDSPEPLDTAPDTAPDTERPAAADSAPEPASAPAARPVPRPPARPVPGPPRRPVAPSPAPAAAPAAPSELEIAAREFGRVTDDGTVRVRTAEGERTVGQVPGVPAEEALAFYTRRYADLAVEVELLERRVRAAGIAPDEAVGSVRKVRASVQGAQAVGDLDALVARLDALAPLLEEQRELRRAERARKQEETRVEKERLVSEAEKLGQGNDWRGGANRLRQLLDEWKALPRLDKAADDALWRRFSTARTTYTRRRKQHFSEVGAQREQAREVKERLATEAEALATSTEWGATAARYRDLMRQWKAAGPAAKDVDDALWSRFRGAQDAFFGARDATNAEVDREFAANAEVKEKLLVQAEALVPVTDVKAAKESFRRIAQAWDEAGKVPRERVKELEGRMRKIEQAIRGIEDDRWRRSNPEARARAADTVAQLEKGLADLERRRDAAVASGDDRAARQHAEAIEARESWLVEARRALEEFSG